MKLGAAEHGSRSRFNVAGAIYAFKQASIVADLPGNAKMAPEAENLRRQLGRKGLRRKKAAKKTGGEPA